MPRCAVKVFDIIEYESPCGSYRIQVRFKGKFIEEFVGRNIATALAKFNRAGYRMGNESLAGVDYEIS